MLKSHKLSYKLGTTSTCSSSREKLSLCTSTWIGAALLKSLLWNSWSHKKAYCVSLLNGHWLTVCCCFCPADLLIKPCDKFLTGILWIGLRKTFKTQPLCTTVTTTFHQIPIMYAFQRLFVTKENSWDCTKIQAGKDLRKFIN